MDNAAVEISTNQFLYKLFDKYDLNSDGRLSRFEFTEIIKYLTRVTGATFPKRPDIEDIFSYLDNDGDLTISREEFMQLTHSLGFLIKSSGIRLLYRGKIWTNDMLYFLHLLRTFYFIFWLIYAMWSFKEIQILSKKQE